MYMWMRKGFTQAKGQGNEKPRKGFTLIELMVVVAVISILAAILFPVFAKARQAARKTTDISNMKQLSLALLMYAQDYDDRFPYYSNTSSGTAKQWPILLYPYFKDVRLLISPSLPEIGSDFTNRSHTNINDYMLNRFPSYGYNKDYLGAVPPGAYNMIGASMAAVQSPSQTVTFVTTATSRTDSVGIPLEPFQPAAGYAYVLPPQTWSGTSVIVNDSYGYAWPTYDGFFIAAFADGHVKAVSVAQLADHSPANNLWTLNKNVSPGCDYSTVTATWCI